MEIKDADYQAAVHLCGISLPGRLPQLKEFVCMVCVSEQLTVRTVWSDRTPRSCSVGTADSWPISRVQNFPFFHILSFPCRGLSNSSLIPLGLDIDQNPERPVMDGICLMLGVDVIAVCMQHQS